MHICMYVCKCKHIYHLTSSTSKLTQRICFTADFNEIIYLIFLLCYRQTFNFPLSDSNTSNKKALPRNCFAKR